MVNSLFQLSFMWLIVLFDKLLIKKKSSIQTQVTLSYVWNFFLDQNLMWDYSIVKLSKKQTIYLLFYLSKKQTIFFIYLSNEII
jgi:hypothetical protein